MFADFHWELSPVKVIECGTGEIHLEIIGHSQVRSSARGSDGLWVEGNKPKMQSSYYTSYI